MKKNLFVIALFLISTSIYGQQQMVTLSGGYTFANIESEDANASGFRINGLYEYKPIVGNLVHGFSVGFIQNSGEVSSLGQDADIKITTWPIYYAPKYLIGKGSGNFFIKGALGLQFSAFKRTSGVTGGEITSNDAGFYGGAGVGYMKKFKETMFVNIEYEWAYASNSYYKDGFINSIMLGIGKIF